MINKILRKLNIALVFVLALVLTGAFNSTLLLASTTSNFKQTINPGTLTTDIVDAAYASVSSPSVTMASTTFSFACASTTGTFGTATQQLYVTNGSAANNGWTLSLAGSAPTALWTSATSSSSFDFNDPTTAGCTDGADTDTVAGQMTVNASGGTLAANGTYPLTNITKGSSNAFNEGTTNSITLLSASAAANKVGKWTLQNVAITQTIPAEQLAANDYNINMVLSIVAL